MAPHSPQGDRGRRALQLTLGTLAAIPFASGTAGMLAGPSALPGQSGQVSATLDSEYRFVNAFWLAAAPVIWSSLPRVEQRGTVLRLALGTVFAGGIGRVISWRRAGRPYPTMVAALGLELVAVPGLLAWQAAVAGAARARQVPEARTADR
ncbi:DUF4345 domain-containing protein [Streptomyces oryzae]|uniref:DUF4345 domain-containing protein n=1 Tax=Streptomyces oryzae TaxID=1434886 RepID=A0ABS3XHR3_9ACTN|nr:DUF4345 domain-containing protein [Streptomyces oryzae]MBO8194873.1 DUF4345 domain-containing protein [Streptomyces oryzae]